MHSGRTRRSWQPSGIYVEGTEGILSLALSFPSFLFDSGSVLQRLQGHETQPSPWEDSEDWLSTRSLQFERLTLADLLSQGTAVL